MQPYKTIWDNSRITDKNKNKYLKKNWGTWDNWRIFETTPDNSRATRDNLGGAGDTYRGTWDNSRQFKKDNLGQLSPFKMSPRQF